MSRRVALKTIPVTILIQTKNEARSIERCIGAHRDFQEVIVVDSESTDDTVELAQKAGARVVHFHWNGRYPKKKQWQLENVSTQNPWVMFVDADEYPTQQLVDELRALDLAHNSSNTAYEIPLQYTFSGRTLAFGHQVIKRCLLNRDSCWFPSLDDLGLIGMGELEGHYQPQTHGRVGRLHSRLAHNDIDPVRSWFDRHNGYSDWEAALHLDRSLEGRIRASRSRQGRVFAAAPFKPALFFIYSYLFRLGVLDGRAGLDYALALAMYYWQIDLKVRELKRGGAAST